MLDIYKNSTSFCRTSRKEIDQLNPLEPNFVTIKQEIPDETANDSQTLTESHAKIDQLNPLMEPNFINIKQEIPDETTNDSQTQKETADETTHEDETHEKPYARVLTMEEIVDEETPLLCKHCGLKCDNAGAFKRHAKAVRQCNFCPKNFCGRYSNRESKVHYKKEHNFKPKNPHICPHCQKPFGHASRLKQHVSESKCRWVWILGGDCAVSEASKNQDKK